MESEDALSHPPRRTVCHHVGHACRSRTLVHHEGQVQSFREHESCCDVVSMCVRTQHGREGQTSFGHREEVLIDVIPDGIDQHSLGRGRIMDEVRTCPPGRTDLGDDHIFVSSHSSLNVGHLEDEHSFQKDSPGATCTRRSWFISNTTGRSSLSMKRVKDHEPRGRLWGRCIA